MYAEQTWRNTTSRELVASKIEKAIHRANILTQRNGMEMEERIFEKAESKDEYFIFVALLMRKIRDCGFRLDGDLAGPSYADIEQPVVDPLNEIPGLALRGPSTRDLEERRRLRELNLLSDIPMPSPRSGSMLTLSGRSAQSEKYRGDYSWKTPAFRKSIISKFDDAMYRYGRPTSKNSMEMEQILFDKAKTRADYSKSVERVLVHIREIGLRNGDSDRPISDISDLIPDPLGVYLAKSGVRRVHYPPYYCSAPGRMPRRLLGGG